MAEAPPLRLLLATRNPGKIRELRALLGAACFQLETLAGHPEVGEAEESGATLAENARLKAAAAAKASGLCALGEDSGLEVDALGGAPGVFSARFAGRHGDDGANNDLLLRELGGGANRRARYVCEVAIARPDGEIAASARGTCEGAILESPRGTGGFGYDPLFVAEGQSRTMAELAPAEKDTLSHRGRAIRTLLPQLARLRTRQID